MAPEHADLIAEAERLLTAFDAVLLKVPAEKREQHLRECFDDDAEWCQEHDGDPWPKPASDFFAAAPRLMRALLVALRAGAQALEKARGCPHGDNCACAIGSRHFWLEAYSEERERVTRLTARVEHLEQAAQALIDQWRTEAWLEKRVSFCADELEAALTARGAAPTDRQEERTD